MAFVGLGDITAKAMNTTFMKVVDKFGKQFDKVTKKGIKKFGIQLAGAVKVAVDIYKSLPFVGQFVDFAKSLMDLGTSPALQLLAELLGALGAIISVILEPLRPFIDLLSIFGMALSASLVPLTAEIYEMLIPAFGEIIAGIPEMTQVITDFIADNPTIFTDLMNLMTSSIVNLIPKIVELLPTIMELTTRFFELGPTIIELIPTLLEVAAKFLNIAFTLIESGVLNSLLIITNAFADLLIVLSPLINIVVGIVNFLSPWMSTIVGGMFGGLPGLIGGFMADVERMGLSVPPPREGHYGGSISGHQYGGMASYTGYHWLEAGEDVSPVGVGGGMGAVEIHIHGNVYGIDNLKDEIFDEYEKRKRLGLI